MPLFENFFYYSSCALEAIIRDFSLWIYILLTKGLSEISAQSKGFISCEKKVGNLLCLFAVSLVVTIANIHQLIFHKEFCVFSHSRS
jgi:hypothetical protein